MTLRLATVLTRVQLDASVGPHVPVQGLLGGKPGSAMFALVGFLARVDAPVLLVGSDGGEVLLTEVTLVGPLASVGPQVHLPRHRSAFEVLRCR